MAGIIEVKDQGKLRIYDADNSHYVDIVVPSSVTANRTITIPDASFTVPQADTNTVYTHPNHSGEVTSTADGATVIADNIVDEANLKVSNAPTNGYFLAAQSGNTGGLTWTEVSAGGITMADQWRLSAHKYGPDAGGTSDITANLERIDTDSPGYIGSAMTQSSGIFTFPVTGTYLVGYVARYVPAGATNRVGINIQVTTNNSSYSNATFAHGSADASGREVNVSSQHLLNVDNTTNVKVKFTLDITGGTHRLEGNSTETRTGFTFIRLGDST